MAASLKDDGKVERLLIGFSADTIGVAGRVDVHVLYVDCRESVCDRVLKLPVSGTCDSTVLRSLFTGLNVFLPRSYDVGVTGVTGVDDLVDDIDPYGDSRIRSSDRVSKKVV